MNKLYPLKFIPDARERIWGGDYLAKKLGKPFDEDFAGKPVGESWELTVRAKENSTIANGAHRGRNLSDLIAEYGTQLTGTDFPKKFPLLIKLLDANDDLSIQVHPNDDYAARIENDCGKTEMWYIVDADEGAEIICGLADGMDAKGFAGAVAEGRTLDALKRRRVHPGDVYFIPAGLPHAIGKGILIAEIQQNCDLTYRVYDYDRIDASGNKRELHVDKALDVVRPFTDGEVDAIRYAKAHKSGENRKCQ